MSMRPGWEWCGAPRDWRGSICGVVRSQDLGSGACVGSTEERRPAAVRPWVYPPAMGAGRGAAHLVQGSLRPGLRGDDRR